MTRNLAPVSEQPLFPKLHSFPPLPMRAVIPLLTGIGGIIVLLAFTFFEWRNALNEVEQEARRDVTVIMSNLDASVSYLLHNNDVAGVQTVLAHHGLQQHMKYLLLSDQSGRVVAGIGAAVTGSSIRTTAPELLDNFNMCWESDTVRVNSDRTLVISCSLVALPVHAGELRAGYLFGAYDLTGPKARSARRAIRQIAMVWLLFAAGFVLMLLLVRRALARRRIAEVVAVTQRIGAGDLRARVARGGRDELAVIGNSVDFMADELENAQRRLQRAHDGMEQRIAMRTTELAETNQMLQREVEVRKQAEEEAHREGALLRSLIQTSQDGVVLVDEEGRIILFNPAAERVFGYTAAEISGENLNLLLPDAMFPYKRGAGLDNEKSGLAVALSIVRSGTAMRKDGESFPVEVSMAEVAAESGVHYAAFIRDMSETHRLQAQLLESERLAAIGTTAAKIGHEIANPLNGMNLTIQLLEQQLAKEPAAGNGHISQNLRKIRGEIARLNHLVQQFRTISRREKYEFRRFKVAELIDDLAAMQQPVCAAAGIQIMRELPEEPTTIRADRGKLTQALLNLIKNSIEATPPGGKIVLKAWTDPHTLTIEVSDSGSGISPEIDVFQPFVTTKSQGTGIGLVVVRQIVTAHRGSITYSSEPGKGTTFTITLPRK